MCSLLGYVVDWKVSYGYVEYQPSVKSPSMLCNKSKLGQPLRGDLEFAACVALLGTLRTFCELFKEPKGPM